MTVFASVDLGGTTVSAGLAGMDGQFLAMRDIPTESYRGAEDVLARIAVMLKELCAETGLPTAIGTLRESTASTRSSTRSLPRRERGACRRGTVWPTWQ